MHELFVTFVEKLMSSRRTRQRTGILDLRINTVTDNRCRVFNFTS